MEVIMTVMDVPRTEAELDASKSILVSSDPNRRSGISDKTIPGSKILMEVLTVPPGERAEPGNNINTEVASYIIRGQAHVLTGKTFTNVTAVSQEEFYFTPVGLPHIIENPSDKPLQMLIAYSLDPSITNNYGMSQTPNNDAKVAVVHKPAETSATSQTRGMQRAPAISAKTVGATQIWMCYLTVSPNERGQAHHHGEAHTAAYTISGTARICFGSDLKEYIEPGPGDFAFDPPGLVHLVDHASDEEPWKGVLARCPANTVVNYDE